MKTFEAIAIRISNLSIERDITLYELSKVSAWLRPRSRTLSMGDHKILVSRTSIELPMDLE